MTIRLSSADPLVQQALRRGRRQKYGNRKTTVDGIVFDSAKEARRYQELRLLEKSGEIRRLRVHPPFALHAFGIDRALVTIGQFSPDFEYERRHGSFDGSAWERVIEDVKSPATRRETSYRLRKRIFEAEYGLEIVEV